MARNAYEVKLCTADTIVKIGVGVVHTVVFSCNDAAPTAGTIDIYDGTSASGTKLFSWTLGTTAFNPTPMLLDAAFATGLFVDFTTTADVNVTVTFA
jgi:hypothetical protein